MSGTHSRRTLDVAVVGSGPAGASAALSLARAGVDVAIFEKAVVPRYKACGGGVVAKARRLLPMDMGEVFEQQCSAVTMNLYHPAISITVTRDEPIVSMTMREDFDSKLLSCARSKGAGLKCPCRVKDMAPLRDHVRIGTDQGVFLARFVVASDGANSIVAKRAGFGPNRHLMPAMEAEISVGEGILGHFANRAQFDLGLIPKGYGWVFPKRDHLSVGIGAIRGRPVDLNGSFRRYVHALGLQDFPSRVHGYVIPLGHRGKGFVKNRTMLTGDAAGFADPVTGEGITFALLSGQMAAQALIEGQLREETVKRLYERALKEHVLPELRWGRIVARTVYDIPRLRPWVFRVYGRQMCEAMTDVVVGLRSYRAIMRNPLTYLNLLKPANARPGLGC
jgi:geranylgeranyl reductase family protein